MTTPSDQQQKQLVQDRFTRTVDVFGDFVMKDRVREAVNLARLVRANENDRAVDLACGPGTLALTFAPRVRWICGVDLTSTPAAACRYISIAFLLFFFKACVPKPALEPRSAQHLR